MKTGLIKKLTAIVAAFAGALGAFADGVVNETDYVEATTGALAANGNDWVASELAYLELESNDSLNRSETGWYAGIRRYWKLSYTGGIVKNYTGTQASNNKVKASFSDNAGRTVSEFSVYKALALVDHDNSPDGSGIKNAFESSYINTTDWNVWVTPEMMHALAKADKDYVATLNIGDETYTITVPRTLELTDGDGVKWYPAIAVVDGKVYGDMGKAVQAAIVAAMDGKTMEFYEEPTGYPANVSAEKVGDVWKLVVNEPMSIESATIALSATEVIVRDSDIEVVLDGVMFAEATLELDKDYTIDESSVLKAKEIGEYTVTVNGMGNYTGSVSATWKIVAPTGEFAADAMNIRDGDPAYGSVAAETPTRFDITDTSKLVYKNDDLGERWEAAVQIRWPREEAVYEIPIINLQAATSVSYTDAAHARIVDVDGEVVYGNEILVRTSGGLYATTDSGSYYVVNGILPSKITYTYFDKLTWIVPIYIKDIEAAIKSGAKHLTFSIKCGSVAWGDETAGNVYGLKETEFTVDLRLSNVFLLDDEGRQIYPQHTHDWSYALSDDGTTLTAKCGAEGCVISQSEGGVSMSLTSKDATNPAYAEGHYRDGNPAEAILSGEDDFAVTGASIGTVKYEAEGGAELDAAPVEPGRYSASVVVTADGSQGAEGSWTLRLGGLEILAGEAIVNGEHARDAATFLERATGDDMEISVGRSYEAGKTYVIPEKYNVLVVLPLTCGQKTYDLAGFTVTAPVDAPLFENNGNFVIRDTSEAGTGAIAANPASEDDTVIVNNGTLAIEGGTFYGSIVNEEGGSLVISGGMFAVKPDDSFVAPGYDLVRRGSMWSVEKHSHNYRFITLAGSHVVIATCVEVFAEGSLQISHCPARVMVGIVGMRRNTPSLGDLDLGSIFDGIQDLLGGDGGGILDTLGKIPNFVIDYDRKEHEADFYALNLTAMADVLRNDALREIVGNLAQSVLTPDEEASLVDRLTAILSDIFKSIGTTSSFKEMFVDKATFEKETGVTFGETSYLLNNEPFDGKPCEAGWYSAIMPFVDGNGTERQLRGEFVINEKELPIETDHYHSWKFEENGASVVATCEGGLSTNPLQNGLFVNDCNVSPMAIELVPSVEGGRKEYDAEELSVAIDNKSTFEVNTGATVSDIVYRTKDGETLDAPPVEPGEYVAEVVVVKKSALGITTDEFTASIDLIIDVKQGTREIPKGSFYVLPSQTGRTWGAVDASGATANVSNGRNLDYDAEAEAWTASMGIDLPSDLNALSPTPRYTDEEHIIVEADEDYSLMTGKFLSLARLGFIDYVAGVVWSPSFMLNEVFAALDAGATTLEFEITVGSNGWLGDLDGVKKTTFRLVVPLEGLVLRRGTEIVNVADAYDIYLHTHTVSGLPTENATVTVDGEEAEVSDDGKLDVYKGKTIAVTPWEGCRIVSFKVGDDDIEPDEGDVYSFVMDDSDMEVSCSALRDIGYSSFVSVEAEDLVYTGEPLTPSVEVIDSVPEDCELVEDTDYTLTFRDANGVEVANIVDVGEYTVVVTGIGAYCGEATATFAVTDYAGDFAAYKQTKIGEVEAMAEEGDSDACKALITDAKATIDAMTYDDTKPLADQKAAVDAVVTQLTADLATQRAADADAAKRAADEAEFNGYKATKIGEVEAMAEEGDSDACKALITDAKAAIDAMTYDSTKPLADQKAAVDAIITQLVADLATQRAADAEAANRAEFDAYKAAALVTVAGMAEEGDSDASTALISDALDAIDALAYDAAKSLDEQKDAIDDIVAALATALITQRASDAADEQRASDAAEFADYKAAALVTVAAMAEEGDSDASTALINDAFDAIDAMEYDDTKPLADQKAAIDDIVADLAAALVAQRAADAEAAQRAADEAEFADYKATQSGVVAAMAEEGDSEASAALIASALAAIDEMEYDDTKPLADQKAEIDAIVTQLEADLATQRAADAETAQRAADEAEFAEYKATQSGVVAAMAEAGDSDASAALIASALAAIDEMEYDDTKPLADQKAEIDAIVTQLEADLATQRAADAEAAQRAADEAEFNDYKATQTGAAEGMAEEGDSDASTALIASALAAIDEMEYDDTKPLADQKAAIDAILAQLEADLAAQRAADAAPGDDGGRELVLHETVTGTVSLSKSSKWLAYLRDAEGNVAGAAAITVGKPKSKTGLSKVKVVVSLPGIRKKTRINGTMDESGVFTVGNNSLSFGSDAVKGVLLGYEVDGSRDLLTSKNRAEKAAAKAYIAPTTGYWTVVWGDAENGWNTASVKLSKNGKASMMGWRPDGKAFSVSGKIALGDQADCVAFVSTKKKAPLAVNMWFLDNGPVIEIGAPFAVASRFDANITMSSATLFSDLFEDGISLSGNWMKLASKNPKARISFSRRTGRFSGFFKTGNQKVNVRGYLVDGVGYGFARLAKTFGKLLVVRP